MLRRKLHSEVHRSNRIGWLRAAVLGANDGIISTASLMLGVAAGRADMQTILLAGVAALVAGSMSMAAGEYVSVSTQADTQAADLERERAELEQNPAGELHELTHIYINRGLDSSLARQVAEQLMAHDALDAHAREELGLTETSDAHPVQAALVSASSFSLGSLLPLLAVALASHATAMLTISSVTVVALILLGTLGAYTGGASLFKGALRVTFWGILAMAITSGVGALFGHIG